MNRYQMLLGSDTREPQAALGWQIARVLPASGLYGANGMIFGPDSRLYVTQAFGSQITAININSGNLKIHDAQPCQPPEPVSCDPSLEITCKTEHEPFIAVKHPGNI